MQPRLVDGGDVVELHRERFALHFDDLGSDEQTRRFDVRFFVEMTGVTAGESVNAAAGAGFDAEVVAERGEQCFREGFGFSNLVVDAQSGSFGELEELIGAAGGFTRGHGMHAVTGAGIGIEVHGLGTRESPQQGLELTEVVLLPKLLVFVRGILLANEENISPLSHGGAQSGLTQAAELGGGEQHAGKTRMQRKLGHLAAEYGDAAVSVGGTEVVEEVFGTFECGWGGGFEPFEVGFRQENGDRRIF